MCRDGDQNCNHPTGYHATGQNPDPFGILASLPAPSAASVFMHEITDEQRVEVLKGKTSKNNPAPSLTNMKKMAKQVLSKDIVGAIRKDIAAADPSGEYGLSEKFENTVFKVYKNSNTIKNMGKEDHSNVLTSLLGLAHVVYNKKVERREGTVAGGRSRRALVQGNNGDNLSDVDKFYRECVDLLQKVDEAAAKKVVEEEGGVDKLLNGLPLEPSMVGRRFDPSRIPKDIRYRNCAFCTHSNTNTVKEDDNAAQFNATTYAENEELMKLWDDFEKERTTANNAGLPPPPFPTNPFKNNKEMKRRPTAVNKSTLRQPRIICLCTNSACSMEGSDAGSSCPIGCLEIGEDGTAKRFEWVTLAGGLKYCPCPVCICPCNKVYNVADAQRIGLLRAQNSGQATAVPPQQQVTKFLGSAITAGCQAMSDIGHVAKTNGWKDVPQGDAEFQQNVFFAAAAEHVVRQGNNQLDSSAIELMQQNLGRGTKVRLPNGQTLDTTTITRNANMHGRNNRIPGVTAASTASQATQPGMLDNLHPDYTNIDTQYQRAALNPENMHSAIETLRQTIGNGPPARAPAASTAAASSGAETGLTEDEQVQFAMQASIESEKLRKYAQLDDHGGKLPANQAPRDVLDLTSPTPPPLQQSRKSTMSTMTTKTSMDGSCVSGGSALLSTFNDVGGRSLSAIDKRRIRRENGIECIAQVKKDNCKFMHTHKDKKSLTKEEKAQRKEAGERSKKIRKVEDEGLEEDVASAMVGDGPSLSQGGPNLTPKKNVRTFDNAYGVVVESPDPDSESESVEEHD